MALLYLFHKIQLKTPLDKDPFPFLLKQLSCSYISLLSTTEEITPFLCLLKDKNDLVKALEENVKGEDLKFHSSNVTFLAI